MQQGSEIGERATMYRFFRCSWARFKEAFALVGRSAVARASVGLPCAPLESQLTTHRTRSTLYVQYELPFCTVTP